MNNDGNEWIMMTMYLCVAWVVHSWFMMKKECFVADSFVSNPTDAKKLAVSTIRAPYGLGFLCSTTGGPCSHISQPVAKPLKVIGKVHAFTVFSPYLTIASRRAGRLAQPYFVSHLQT